MNTTHPLVKSEIRIVGALDEPNIFGDHAPMMLELVYSPVPLKTDRNPLLKGWQDLRDEPLSRETVDELAGDTRWLGIGVVGGFDGLSRGHGHRQPGDLAAVAKRAFAETCIRTAETKLASLRPGGGRNIALFRAACSLGKFAHNGIVTDHEVRSALMDAARVNGYVANDGEHQAQLTITSGFNISRNDPLPGLDSLPGASTRYSRRRG